MSGMIAPLVIPIRHVPFSNTAKRLLICERRREFVLRGILQVEIEYNDHAIRYYRTLESNCQIDVEDLTYHPKRIKQIKPIMPSRFRTSANDIL